MVSHTTVVIFAAGLAGAAVYSEASPAQPDVVVPVVSTAPAVDCVLDDEAWSGAATLENFYETHPGDNATPKHATQVKLAFTPHALYVGIRAEEDSGRVRATLGRRDAIGDDDTVTLYLDTFHDQRRAYVVMVNPLGVQQDGVFVEGSETDFSFDLDMQSKGCLAEGGYAVEIAIPFESLRYQAGLGRTWGLHVVRQSRHTGEEDSWKPLRRDRIGASRTSTQELRARFLAQAGNVAFLEGIRHSPVLEWIPVATGSRAEGQAADFGLGGTARLLVSPALAIDVAANPDFAEVEADELQSTANQRFPLFFPEKRPFFLEGADLFQTPVRAFHSRTIMDPDAAVKVTGTRGRTRATSLFAVDHEAYAGVLRVHHDVGAQSGVGLLATHWQRADQSSQVAGFDGRLALGARTVWTFQVLGSASRLPSPAPEDGVTRVRTREGLAYFSEWARSGQRLSLQVAGEGYSPGYRAALGYTQRADTNRLSAIARYNGPPRGGGPLVSWSALDTTIVQFDWRGRMQYGYTYPRLLLAFQRQGFLNLSAYRDYQRVFEEELGAARTPSRPGAFAGPRGERSSFYHGFTIDAGIAPSQRVSVSALFDRSWNNLDFDQGAGPRFPRVSPAALLDPNGPLDPGPGVSRSFAATLTLQPVEALRLSASHERSSLRRYDTGRVAYDQHLTSLRLHYAFSRFTSVRGRLDHDSLDGRLFQQAVFGWTPRPGTAFYLGYDETGDWSDGLRAGPSRYIRRGRTLFAKLSLARRNRLGGRAAVDGRTRPGRG